MPVLSIPPPPLLLLQDGNLGLVKLVEQSLVKRNIQRLTQTYLTLSLSDIAANVGLPSAEDAEMHILRYPPHSCHSPPPCPHPTPPPYTCCSSPPTPSPLPSLSSTFPPPPRVVGC